MIPETIAHYRIADRVGTGGMGEVYRARDLRLERIVALKILSSAVASDPDQMRRFIQEARAAATISHPNVAHIYEIGEKDGIRFIAMEFVEGGSLRSRMKQGPLELNEALDIAEQAASGLAVAHRNGIVHRDLKPENIMLRVDGCVKLVDFGLAKMMPWGVEKSSATTETMPDTHSGQLLGTFNYMSPEQARGKPVTQASDVFSFGIILYELLTDEHPFQGETTMDTLQAILSKEPIEVSVRSAAVPEEISRLVSRALQKDIQLRFPSAIELVSELKRAREASVSGQPVSESLLRHKPRWIQGLGVVLILVLLAISAWSLLSGHSNDNLPRVHSVALLSLRSSPEDSAAPAVSEGLLEDLAAALTKKGLSVASRSAALGLQGVSDPRLVGSQLGVDAVLAGSIRTVGNKFRLHLELSSTRTGFQIWSETFTMDATDLLSGGKSTVEAIARQLDAAVKVSR